MAKIKGPLLSQEARGMIGERLTFSKRRSGQQARFQRAQKDSNTTEQQTERALYTAGRAIWNAFSNDTKESYKTLAQDLLMTGYNYFMRIYLLGQYVPTDQAYFGTGIYGNVIYGSV